MVSFFIFLISHRDKLKKLTFIHKKMNGGIITKKKKYKYKIIYFTIFKY